MNVMETSIVIDGGGKSQKVAVSGTSAQSAAIPTDYVYAYLTKACFVRCGDNPTAVNDGTDTYVPASVPLRLNVTPGSKLAFISVDGTAGDAYLTPRA